MSWRTKRYRKIRENKIWKLLCIVNSEECVKEHENFVQKKQEKKLIEDLVKER